MHIQISWLLQKPTDLDLHCLQRQGNPGSAGQGLINYNLDTKANEKTDKQTNGIVLLHHEGQGRNKDQATHY